MSLICGGTMSYDDVNEILYNQDWTAFSMENDWITYGSVFGTPRYRRVNGIVYVEMLVKKASGTATGTICTLPVGFRPSVKLITCQSMNPSIYSRIDIGSDGQISPIVASISWTGVVASFPAEQ